MQVHGWRIIPINPNATEILGEPAYPTLTEASRHHSIELVNVFRNSEDVPPVVDEAIAVGAKAIWLQLGIEHAVAAQKASAAGLQVVQNKCLMVEYRNQQR
jgi:predicted CoA-binding protein